MCLTVQGKVMDCCTFVLCQWGGEKYEDVQRTRVVCTVLPGIECYGNRTFLTGDIPCIR